MPISKISPGVIASLLKEAVKEEAAKDEGGRSPEPPVTIGPGNIFASFSPAGEKLDTIL
jgi:hypothetical protein